MLQLNSLHAPFGAASPDLGPRHLMAPAFFRRGLDAEVEPLAAVSTANASPRHGASKGYALARPNHKSLVSEGCLPHVFLQIGLRRSWC